ncbi:hypothetical protein BGZ89_002135 [Linnemannia elongata]|nr:hypothetical protein BGZ89_002135 [Linnemannia elongata]
MEKSESLTTNNENRPKVLIVGGGLTVERAPEIKALGRGGLHGPVANIRLHCYLIDGNGRSYVDIWNEFHSLSRELSVVQVLTAPDLEIAFLISATENAAKR